MVFLVFITALTDSDLFYDKYILWLRNRSKTLVNNTNHIWLVSQLYYRYPNIYVLENFLIYQYKHIVSHDFPINLFSANIKVFVTTICINNVKDMILTMLYSWFMAKCNQVYWDMFYELVGDKLYLFWFLIPKMLWNIGVSIRTVFLNFHFFKKMSIFGTELFAYRFAQMVQNGTKHQI